MSTIRHFCVSVRGQLTKNNRKLVHDWKGIITVNGRKLMTAGEIRELFMDELARGHEVVPLGDPCEGFNYKTGCPGHEEPEESETL